jgi:hypothetical protein
LELGIQIDGGDEFEIGTADNGRELSTFVGFLGRRFEISLRFKD